MIGTGGVDVNAVVARSKLRSERARMLKKMGFTVQEIADRLELKRRMVHYYLAGYGKGRAS